MQFTNIIFRLVWYNYCFRYIIVVTKQIAKKKTRKKWININLQSNRRKANKDINGINTVSFVIVSGLINFMPYTAIIIKM